MQALRVHLGAAVAVGLALAVTAGAVCAGDGLRSRVLRAEFQRLNPCPANGQRRGPCPGFEVDHKVALVCGGRDEIGNLQWLARAEHVAKSRHDVRSCRIGRRAKPSGDEEPQP